MKLEVVIILGGGPLQRDLIEAACKRFHVIILDGNAECALKNLANEFVHLDFSDVEKVLAFAKATQPRHILTMANEKGNFVAAVVSRELGLYYNSVQSVVASLNKLEMKDRLAAADLKTASYFPLHTPEDWRKLPNAFRFPLVVKPAQSSAARGVKLVNDMHELAAQIPKCLAVSENGSALVEEYVRGEQYSVETISMLGKHRIIGITKEFFTPAPYFMETAHLFPADLTSVVESKVNELALQVLDAFDVEVGACHIELRISDDGTISIIEVATRLGGWRSELANRALGVNIAEIMLDSYGKKQGDIASKWSKFSMVHMLYSDVDKVKESKLRSDGRYCVDSTVELAGDFKRKKTSLMDSAGYYYLTADTLEDIYETQSSDH